MRFLTVKSGVPSRAYAVVAKETEVPAPSVAIPVTFKFPLTAKSPPTTLTPVLAVTSPTESTLVTSS